MAEDKWMMDTGSKTMEGAATVVQGLEPWNGTSNDDGAGDFRTGSPTFENILWNFWRPPAGDQEENAEKAFVEAVAEDGYGQVENGPVVVPSSTTPAGGTGAVTQPSDDLSESDDSSSCSMSTTDHEENSEENCVKVLAEEGYRQVENDPGVVPSSTMPSGGYGTCTQPVDDLPQSGDSSSCSTPTDDLQMPVGTLDMPCKLMMSCIRSLSQTDENTLIKRHRGVYKSQKVKIYEYPGTLQREFSKVIEMGCLRHYLILPLLGYAMRYRLVMYPQMVRGDLTNVCTELSWTERLRILYQLSAGLAFLHSSQPGVREKIWHGSIKAENIYLDQNLNARIGGFSKAIELRTKSASPSDMVKDDARRKKWLKDDIYNLTSVGLLLLKSLDGTDYRPRLPNVKKVMCRKMYWDMTIWKHIHHRTRKEIVILIVRCSRKRITAERLEINLKILLRSHRIPLYNLSEDRSNYCINCCVNTQDVDPVPVPTSEFCPDACPSRRFCRTCYQTSYRNILFCPDHGPLKDKIHQKDVYAILVSGSGKTSEEQNILDGDVESMFNVITDPRIMGISATNVFQISHNSADKRQEIYRALKNLKTKTVHTLMFFYSGHGSKAKDDEDSDEDDIPRFQFGDSIDTSMTDEDLRKLLTPYTTTNLFVIMDCCYAARYKILPQHRDSHPNIWRVQVNGTGSSTFGWMDSKINSVYTCCLVRGLEGGFSCPEGLCNVSKCEAGDRLRRSARATGYIFLYNCCKYIATHAKDYNVDSNLFISGISDDLAIARYSGSPLFIFKYDIGGKRRRLMMYQLQDNPDDMLRQLWDEMDSVVGKSSRRRLLPKNLDFRCLKMVVPGIRGEREIQEKREVIHECCRGHIIQIRLRSTSQDLDRDRCVVCFYCYHNRFKEVLDKVQFYYKDFFMYGFETRENIEVLQAAVIGIKLAEEPGLSQLQSLYCDYERKDFMTVIVTCLTRAYEMGNSNKDILGLRVNITPNLAMLELEMKKH